MNIVLINLESKRPTVEQARIRLDQALREAKSQNQKVLKLIHGYGSSGKGGAIKKDVAEYLLQQKASGRISAFLSGDDFSPFNPETQRLLSMYPTLFKDKDYARGNLGITLVFL